MKADFTPLSGRASYTSFEFLTPSTRKSKSEGEIPVKSEEKPSRLHILRLTTRDIAMGQFSLQKGLLRKSREDLSGHRISRQEESLPLSFLTLKAAEAEYETLLKFIHDERRLKKLKQAWSNLKENFQEFVQSLKPKNPRVK